jgi:hypothetical protein
MTNLSAFDNLIASKAPSAAPSVDDVPFFVASSEPDLPDFTWSPEEEASDDTPLSDDELWERVVAESEIDLSKIAVERQQVYTLSDKEMAQLVEIVYEFCIKACGVTLYPYQQEFARRMVLSLLREDADELTALFSRQSGKTEVVATVTVGCLLILPKLHQIGHYGQDSRIAKFKHGLWVGVFGPTSEIAEIMYGRMRSRLRTEHMQQVLADPDIDLDLPDKQRQIAFANGSFVDCVSASPQSKIEGKTYHLIITEETQDITDTKLRKSIHPMGAATAATLVKIGTPSVVRNDFYDACERGKRMSYLPVPQRTHFQYDYTHAMAHNPRYKKYIEKEIERLGYDSEDFKMSYRLMWLVDRGMFIGEESMLFSCRVEQPDELRHQARQGAISKFTRSAAFIRNPDPGGYYVAGLDVGKSIDPSVLTIARVFVEHPQQGLDEKPRFYTHVVRLVMYEGDNHEQQFPKILEELRHFRVRRMVMDSTGAGGPIYDRFAAALKRGYEGAPDIRPEVVPFVFSRASKHDGYMLLGEELKARRFTYPSGPAAKKSIVHQEAERQFLELKKRVEGPYIVVEAPSKKESRGGKKPHDDFPDSWMLCCWAANTQSSTRVMARSGNVFYARGRRSSMTYAQQRDFFQSRLRNGI